MADAVNSYRNIHFRWLSRVLTFLKRDHRKTLLFTIIVVINLLLVSPDLTPTYSKINAYDEAKYIESGWMLLLDGPRDLAWGPIVALVYAPVHLIVGSSLDWFMIEARAGRIILFLFLWLSTFYLGLQFKEDIHPLVTAGILFVSVPFFRIIENQSDAVFVGFSMLGFAKLTAYAGTHRLKEAMLASIFLGLGVLARVETVTLLGIFLLLAVVIGWRYHPVVKILLSAVLPALGILVLFFISSLLTVGGLNLGISYKSYDSFVSNQSILTGGDLVKAKQETDRLFGTQEENKNSVIRAILRNPPAFGLRIIANIKGLPDAYLYFFNKKLGPFLLFFAFWGIYVLIQKRAFLPLIMFLLWSLPTTIALGFLARHFIPQTFFIPMILAAIGISQLVDRDPRPTQQIVLLSASVILTIYSFLDQKLAFFTAGILITTVLALIWLLWPYLKSSGTTKQVPLLLLFATGLILRNSYPFPNYPDIGKSKEELAVHYMEQELPSLSQVLVPVPLPAVAARMFNVNMLDVPSEINSPQELWQWITDQKIRAIYLDSNYRNRPEVYDLVEAGIGHYYDVGFTSEDGTLRIIRVRQ